MTRLSRLVSIREFLEKEISKVKRSQEISVSAEQYALAELYKGFKGVLSQALFLCVKEKPKGATDEIKS